MNTAIIAIAFLTPSTAVDFPIEKNALTPALVQETHISLPDPVTTPKSDLAHSQGLLELLMEHFPREIVPVMYQIALAESNLNTKAYNPESHKNCQGSYGVYQIACVNYKGVSDDLFDLETNVLVAKEVYERQGLRAWGVCTNGTLECDIITGIITNSKK